MAKITEYEFSQEELQVILTDHVKAKFNESNVNVSFDVAMNMNQSDNSLNIKLKAKVKCLS